MNRKNIIIATIIVFLSMGHICAMAQTGSRIKEGGGKQPETVVWFSEPTAITDIRLLLQAGKKQQAIEEARDFVSGLRSVAGAEARTFLYFGLSALCSALTSIGEYQEAIKACSEAIDIFPSRWQALNNRGVAYYAWGKIDLALQDYRQALSLVEGAEPVVEMIQHNLKLAEAKK